MASHAGIVGRLMAALPTGRTLPEEVWLRRHKALLTVLWLHAVGLTIFASLRGYDLLHAVGHGAPLVVLACMAMAAKGNRRAAAAFVSLGLISSSALLVHSWDGVIEGHFHFFVMIALLTLYEDWFPFLLAAAYVVLHHGLMGALDPGGVYNHPDAVAHPWKWAAIHGGFVVAAGTASVVTWRLNENVRAETQSAYRRARESEERFKSAFSDAPIGMVLATIETDRAGQFLQVNRAMCELTGYSEEELLGMRFSDITHPDDIELSVPLKQRALDGEVSSYEISKRYVHADGHAIWAQVHVSLVRDSSGEPVHTIAQVEDITERRRAEESLAGKPQAAGRGAEARPARELAVEPGDRRGHLVRGALPDLRTGSGAAEVVELLEPLRAGAPGRAPNRSEAIIDRSLARREPFHEEMRIIRADGASASSMPTARSPLDTNGKPDEDGRHRPGRDRAQDRRAKARAAGGGGEGAQGAQRLPFPDQPRAAHPPELDPRIRAADGDGRARRGRSARTSG